MFHCTGAQLTSVGWLRGTKPILAVLLCQLPSTEEGSRWEYSCAWDQLRTQRKEAGEVWVGEAVGTTVS